MAWRWTRWAPALAAVLILASVAVSLTIWPRAKSDIVYRGFDPNLLSTSVEGDASAGQVTITRTTLGLSAGPGSKPTAHLFATALTFVATFDLRIVRDGGGSDPLEINVWSPRDASGCLLRFGASPWHSLTQQNQSKGAWGPIVQLGSYEPGTTYHASIALDHRQGTLTIDMAPTGSAAATGLMHTVVSASDVPGLFPSLPVAVTLKSVSTAGQASALVSGYQLRLPPQAGLPSKTDGTAPLTAGLLVLGVAILVMALAREAVRRRRGELADELARRKGRLVHRRWLLPVLLIALLAAGYVAASFWLFQLGAHTYDMAGEKIFAYVGAAYGPVDLYSLPATVTPARVWNGVPYAEVSFPYGPVMAIVFTAIGVVYRLLAGSGGAPTLDSAQLELLIKLFNVAAGLADATLIYLIVRSRLGVRPSLAAAALFLLNPAVWFMMSLWGETQSISLLFLLVAIWRVQRDDPVGAWVAIGLTVFSRPQMIVPAAILGLYLLRRFPVSVSVRALSWAIIVAFVVSAPITLLSSPAAPVAYLEQIAGAQTTTPSDQYSYVSYDGYNIWPLFTGAVSHQSSNARLYYAAANRIWGPLSYATVGTLLFGGITVILCLWLVLVSNRLPRDRIVPFLLAATLGLLIFKTGVSSHHFVIPLALLIPCLGLVRLVPYAGLLIALSATTMVSMWGSLAYALASAPSLYPSLHAEHNALTKLFMQLFSSDLFITAATLTNLAILAASLVITAITVLDRSPRPSGSPLPAT